MLVLVLLVKLATFNLNLSIAPFYLQLFFVLGVLVISILGVYRAMVPAITEYEVKIKNLPDAWDGKTIVQISDVHLGPVYRKNFFNRVIDKINALDPEAVFITGDLFDGMEAEFSWLNHPLNRIKTKQGTYYGFGNHDLYLGFNQAVKLLEGNPVIVLNNEMKIVNGLQIIGINYSFQTNFDLEREILKQVGYDVLKPSLLLFHTPKNIPLAKSAGIDLQLSGHTHDGQIFPFNFLAKWAHNGYGYGFFEEGDFSLIVNGGVGTWGPPMRTAARSEIVKIVLRKK
jgi:hypothetical protein